MKRQTTDMKQSGKRIVLLALCILCCALLLSSCSASSTTTPTASSPAQTAIITPAPEPAIVFGATGGNLLNGGSWCFMDGTLYGMKGTTQKNAALYAQQKDGEKKLAEGIGSQLNVADGYLYYLSYPNGLLYKVPVNASAQPVKLSSDKMLFLFVAEGSIYYTLDKSAALYVMKTDGTGKELLSDGKCYDLAGTGDIIYYTDTKNSVFCMRNIHTGQLSTIPMGKRGFAQVYKDRVYFQNETDGKKLYSCKLDGSDKKVLLDKAVSAINVANDSIYFSNDGDKGKAYRMSPDGTGITKFADVNAEFITVCGDTIFIVSNLNTGTIYKLDGNGQLTKL